MAQANFSFISDASGGDQFTVVNFSATEGISSLYQYDVEIKAPVSSGVDLDDVLDNPARFVTELDGDEDPVYGVLSSFDELQIVQGYVYYRAVLVPRLWWLSAYKTNEIYTEEKTVDKIIQTVLENAGLASGTDFDLGGLDISNFLQRDYVCQFGESDYHFISRLMENEGIFFYFEHEDGPVEKIIFVNDTNYTNITEPELIFDVAAQASRQHDCINAWSCRKQRLPAEVTVRDFNPEQPSLDIADTVPIDSMGQGTEYLYGVNIKDGEEAAYLSGIRAEERLCLKTRYYGESSVTRMRAGHVFALDGHPNSNYNGAEYLVIEVGHQGQHLDMAVSERPDEPAPQYSNNFVAMDAGTQYRPARTTPKPRFFGNMTAFVYAETGAMNAEVDLEGRYRVHLPFDRADGTKDSTDPNRKASTWIRMAQPYVGEEQGMYFPLAGGTEVLLTFINGDPDQPIISGALPNASEPSLLNSEMNLQRTVTAQASQTVTGNTHKVSRNSARIALMENPPAAPNPATVNCSYINDGTLPSMIPPWDGKELTDPSPAYDENLIKFMKYDKGFGTAEMTDTDVLQVSTDRGAGDNYIYANARTFAYPQHERVYFIGTFHEDFHVKDDFLNLKQNGSTGSWTRIREQWNFPAPGARYPEGTDPQTDSDAVVNPNGVRGVSEDKRWGDQMTYAWGRSFAWAGGPAMGTGQSFAAYNYGNGYTENLITENGGTSEDADFALTDLRDQMEYDAENGWVPSDNPVGNYAGWPGVVAKAIGWLNSGIKMIADVPDTIIHARDMPGEKHLEETDAIKDSDATTKEEAMAAVGAGIFEMYAEKFTGQRKRIDTSELKQARKLFPGDTAVEKTFGNTYSYQAGLAVDIHEGHTISRRYGDLEETVTGDDCVIVHGDKYETVVGNASCFTMGITSETFVGLAFEWKLAGESSVKLAAESAIHLGAKFDLFWGAQLGIKAGPDTQLGTESWNIFNAKGDIATTDLAAKTNEISKSLNKLVRITNHVASKELELKNVSATLKTIKAIEAIG